MRGLQQLSNNRKLLLIPRTVDHDDIIRKAVFASQRMTLAPAVGNDLIHKLRRNRHVQTAIMGWVKMGKFTLDHKSAVTVRAARQVKGSRSRNGYKAPANRNAAQRFPNIK